jgi:hypothetical protein
LSENIEETEMTYEYLYHLLAKESKLEKSKAAAIASQFSSLGSFYKTDFVQQTFVRADGTEIKLNSGQRARIEGLKKLVLHDSDVKENWIHYLSTTFIECQLKNIADFTLDKMNMNPFLLKALKLTTPEEAIRFNFYQSITRSIVTSMGNCLEQMVGHSGGQMGQKGDWFDVVKKVGNFKYWIQIKSGPNDVDKDQVSHFNRLFDLKETEKDLPCLGITYGKRDLNTVSMGHIKAYLEKWEERLLVGRELWEFVSGEKDYHDKVLNWIDEIATALLEGTSINQEIERVISRLIFEFAAKYGDGVKGLTNYINKAI